MERFEETRRLTIYKYYIRVNDQYYILCAQLEVNKTYTYRRMSMRLPEIKFQLLIDGLLLPFVRLLLDHLDLRTVLLLEV